MKIILSGGGTMGSVTPLIAISEQMPEAEILFVGTKNGPEKEIIEVKKIKFIVISSAKFRRYFSGQNFIDLLKIIIICWQSFWLLYKEKPQVIVSAGGYVAVPLIWMGWLLRIPSLVHSQDIKTGLAIKLVRPFATKITKAFSDTDLNAEVVGNPVRNLEITTNIFKLKQDKPVVLITGGGTGAGGINNLISKELFEIAQIIHLTGKAKNNNSLSHSDYHVFEFLNEAMIEALQKADIIITRAGLGTLTELAMLEKPIIIIPISNSHQEDNAEYFKKHQAAIVLSEVNLTADKLNSVIKNLLNNKSQQTELSSNIKTLIKPHASETLATIIKQLANRT
ncbi:MAG: UDP-N-acetylglucosamine--N-acetylmuramyl-(pentapeptide) pyrophosphoryl-undecaprenol N-acetylglucosamine transferase [Patescibacteria group bacterium]